MKSNVGALSARKVFSPRTHEGGLGAVEGAEALLLRQVATCMLFENTFYESGSEIAKGIAKSASQVGPKHLAHIAIQARSEFNLRHVPLFLLSCLDDRRAEEPGLLAHVIPHVLQRADELAELLAVHAKRKGVQSNALKKILSAQMKKGLARAFQNFSPYALAKYNRDSGIKLRDVLFLVHAKPKDEAQAATWKALVEGTLPAPDTWEVALSSGADKKSTWERLIGEEKLGDLAFLRNLRNMSQVGVDLGLIKASLRARTWNRVLPFRFLAAATHAPLLAQDLSDAMIRAGERLPKLPGDTLIVVDVSGSMDAALSAKSDLTRLQAAGALAILLREVCPAVRVFTFSNDLKEVPNYRGIPLGEAIYQSQAHRGTNLMGALTTLRGIRYAPKGLQEGDPSRVVVITDEQADHGGNVPPWAAHSYIINCAPYRVGVETKGWTRINGFSERVVDFIRYSEGLYTQEGGENANQDGDNS